MELFSTEKQKVYHARSRHRVSSEDLFEQRNEVPARWALLDGASQQCLVCGLSRLTVIFWAKRYCERQRSPELIDEDMYFEEKAE